MVVYDVNKSQFGLNPLTVYRLSTSAIEALHLNDLTKLTVSLVQDTITSSQLTIDSFFETVDTKIHRSHLLQAFLFDHIQPHMPAFNTEILTLGSTSNQFTHHLYKSVEQSQNLLEELSRVEGQHKKMMQQAKRNNKKMQMAILANKDKTVKGSTADKEEREALEGVKVPDNVDSKMDLFLLSKQVETLCANINEFDDCFAQKVAA